MPKVINGFEKSMTFSLSDVMVKEAAAKSAFCSKEQKKKRARWNHLKSETHLESHIKTQQAN